MAFKVRRRSGVNAKRIAVEIISLIVIMVFGQDAIDSTADVLGVDEWTEAVEGNSDNASYKFTYKAFKMLGLTSGAGSGFLSLIMILLVFSVVLEFIKIDF